MMFPQDSNDVCRVSDRAIEHTGRTIELPPAEDAFIRAGQTWRCFHATVALDPVEGVLVTSSSTSQHGLRMAMNE